MDALSSVVLVMSENLSENLPSCEALLTNMTRFFDLFRSSFFFLITFWISWEESESCESFVYCLSLLAFAAWFNFMIVDSYYVRFIRGGCYTRR